MNRKRAYKVKWNRETRQIEITHKNKTRSFIFSNFVHGTGWWLSETDHLPNYVHDEVWKIHEKLRKGVKYGKTHTQRFPQK